MKHSKHPHTALQLSGLRIEDPRLERISELPGKYKTYSPEFCDEAARQVVETSRAIADVARELGISRCYLHRLLNQLNVEDAAAEAELQEKDVVDAVEDDAAESIAPAGVLRAAARIA